MTGMLGDWGVFDWFMCALMGAAAFSAVALVWHLATLPPCLLREERQTCWTQFVMVGKVFAPILHCEHRCIERARP